MLIRERIIKKPTWHNSPICLTIITIIRFLEMVAIINMLCLPMRRDCLHIFYIEVF